MSYGLKLKVGNKVIHCRKWKGKDKKRFVAAINKENVSETDVMQALVYDCIEEDVNLDVEEFRFVLSRIRAYSLGENIHTEFYCESCGNLYEKNFKLKDIITYSFKEGFSELKSGDTRIKIGEIKNRELYTKYIQEDDIYDLLLRVESINNDDSFNLETLIDKFDDLDLDVLADLLEQFEASKFKVLDVNTVECTHCEKETKFKFDELPGFFPETWFTA